MEACLDGDVSSSSILSQSRNGIVGVFLVVALARIMASDEKLRASGTMTSASAVNSANCSVAAMGVAAGR